MRCHGLSTSGEAYLLQSLEIWTKQKLQKCNLIGEVLQQVAAGDVNPHDGLVAAANAV